MKRYRGVSQQLNWPSFALILIAGLPCVAYEVGEKGILWWPFSLGLMPSTLSDLVLSD